MPAAAQSMNNTVSSNRNLENTSFPGQTIVHRGMVSSEEPTHVILPPGEALSLQLQMAVCLPMFLLQMLGVILPMTVKQE